jgi:single-strand DNA-binding protein
MSAFTMNNRIPGTKVHRRIVGTYEYEISGEIHRVDDTQTYGSGFRVREFVVLDESFDPQPIVFKLLQDKVELVENLQQGDRVKVTFELQGRFGEGQWAGRIFTNLEAVSVEALLEEGAIPKEGEKGTELFDSPSDEENVEF